MILQWFTKVFAALNANSNPAQIAGGVACAFLIALLPGLNLFAVLILIITFFIRINTVMMFIFIPIFQIITPLLDPILNWIRFNVLRQEFLQSVFTRMSEMPIIPLSGFNNTLVAGGLITGIALFVPVFLLFIVLVNSYRKHIRDKIANSRFAKAFSKIPLISKMAKGVLDAKAMF
jgi:uncharacterized protein (TIGR03546 family)